MTSETAAQTHASPISSSAWRFGPTWRWLAIAAIAQAALLTKIVVDRQRLLSLGTEVALPVVPVDPRDLFRGDYVTLGYAFTPIKLQATDKPEAVDQLKAGDTVFVTLRQSPDGAFSATSVSTHHPQTSQRDDVVIRGTVRHRRGERGKADDQIDVRFCIERYFVPEGTGRMLEDKVRDQAIKALVAVGPDGTAGIKGLMVDGQRHVDPPLL